MVKLQEIPLTNEAFSENIEGVTFQKYRKIELNVFRGKNRVSLQIKESKYYNKKRKGVIGHSWHQIARSEFARDKRSKGCSGYSLEILCIYPNPTFNILLRRH